MFWVNKHVYISDNWFDYVENRWAVVPCEQWWKNYPIFLSQSKDTLIENDSSKSHPVKYYVSQSLKIFILRFIFPMCAIFLMPFVRYLVLNILTVSILGSQVGQQSKALHLSARGVTTVPGSNPGWITSGCDLESHRAAHNWLSIVSVLLYFYLWCHLNHSAIWRSAWCLVFVLWHYPFFLIQQYDDHFWSRIFQAKRTCNMGIYLLRITF